MTLMKYTIIDTVVFLNRNGKLVQRSKPKGKNPPSKAKCEVRTDRMLYPLNSQIIDKSPPHFVLRDWRGLNIRVFAHEDIPELI